MLSKSVSPAPPMWFRLPPGYHDLDAISSDDLNQAVSAVLPPILESDPAVDSSLDDMRTLLGLLSAIREGGSVHTSIGVHPDGKDGASISLFSLSVTHSASRTAGLAVAQSALALASSPLWSANTCKLLELPMGLPAALVAGRLSPPPLSLLERAGVDAAPCEIFQARLTVPFPTGSHVAVADLASAATRHAESYTDILECIAQTLVFTSPASPISLPQPPSRILDLLS
ncbi:hypothetical protein OG883_12010 [Streptomyces sp. NBC_01142]|uniref:hypothetical protein n=1 Tax=Streptomyces sp. NBC_01142 TaxID=2975865 RepID=UPI002257F402|nr:hypothetical protein [Streptomyces sp. NBC_01142]MCX4820623.1 hypothetical protein [Streptomyces sp. NBC_01142]